jgi:AcrR family transcriptional regulator
LSLDAIVSAAHELVERDGADALTMRRLAEELGSGAMSLYRHIGTKEQLFAALADRYFSEIQFPAGPALSWDQEIGAIFSDVYQLLLRRPVVLRIVSSQHLDGLVAYRGAERVLAALRAAGIDDEEATQAFEILACYTFGAALRHVEFPATGPGTSGPSALADLPAAEFPNLRALGPILAARRFDFDAGLRRVLAGLAPPANLPEGRK